MARVEIDSFYTKFKHLLNAGYDATISFEARKGEAFVTLHAGLGLLSGKIDQGFEQNNGFRKRNRGPSYLRRQDRRKVQREVVSDSVKDLKETAAQACTGSYTAMEVTENEVVGKKDVSASKSCTKTEDVNVKKFECSICDFTSSWNNALTVHISNKHGNPEKVDDHTVSEDDNSDLWKSFDATRHYWKSGSLGTCYQTFLDVNSEIENSTLNQAEQEVEKDRALQARKDAFGKEFEYYPPWKKW